MEFNRIPLIAEYRTDYRSEGRSRGTREREAISVVQMTDDGVGIEVGKESGFGKYCKWRADRIC